MERGKQSRAIPHQIHCWRQLAESSSSLLSAFLHSFFCLMLLKGSCKANIREFHVCSWTWVTLKFFLRRETIYIWPISALSYQTFCAEAPVKQG